MIDERQVVVEGENNGTQAAQQEQQSQQQQQEAQAQEVQGAQGTAGGTQATGGGGAPDYEAQLAERDKRIAELEGKVAETAKTAEAQETLNAEIAALKKQGEDERVEFALMLAGCRNIKAARGAGGPRRRRGGLEGGGAVATWIYFGSGLWRSTVATIKTVGFGAGTLLMAFPLPFMSMAVFMKAVVLGITLLETFPAIVSIQEVVLGRLLCHARWEYPLPGWK